MTENRGKSKTGKGTKRVLKRLDGTERVAKVTGMPSPNSSIEELLRAGILKLMLNHHDKQSDNGDSITSKHSENHYGQASNPETSPKSRNEEVGKSDTIAAILSQPVCDVFVQHDKSFRRTDRKKYEKMLEARTDDLVSITPSESVQAALAVQTAFHNISFIIQGFLSGFGTSHAIFAFAFADFDVLHKSYAWLAMPIQATFYTCFVISTIAALDRLEISFSSMDSLKRGLSLQSGGLDILLCLIGTTATLVSTLCDEWFATPMKQREKIQDIIVLDPLVAWRLLSGIRAIAGLLNWLLLALSPNSNILLKQIRNPESAHENCEVP